MNKLINICLAAALSLSANASMQPDLTDDTASVHYTPCLTLPHVATSLPQDAVDRAKIAIQRTVNNFRFSPDGLETITIEFDPEKMRLMIFTDEDYDEEEYCTVLNTLSNLEGVNFLKLLTFNNMDISGNAKLALKNFLDATPIAKILDASLKPRISDTSPQIHPTSK